MYYRISLPDAPSVDPIETEPLLVDLVRPKAFEWAGQKRADKVRIENIGYEHVEEWTRIGGVWEPQTLPPVEWERWRRTRQ